MLWGCALLLEKFLVRMLGIIIILFVSIIVSFITITVVVAVFFVFVIIVVLRAIIIGRRIGRGMGRCLSVEGSLGRGGGGGVRFDIILAIFFIEKKRSCLEEVGKGFDDRNKVN